MRIVKRIGLLIVLLVVLVGLYVGGAWLELYGKAEGPGTVTSARVPEAVVAARGRAEQQAAAKLASGPTKQILFGDLHVHTTFSTDAFLWSLPMVNGEGAHPVADACDFARFCSGLDFWSINDHAEATTPTRWQEAKETIRQCNAVAGNAANPDLVSFIGWEWSQVGLTPKEHYGHKNVIFRDLGDDQVPSRAIGAGGLATTALRGSIGGMPWFLPLVDFRSRERYYNFIEYMNATRAVPACPEGVSSRDLPTGCYETAATPRDLFRKLDEWGFDTIVIPHGNTWGFYTPPGATWDKQLAADQDDPAKQILVEVFSGHGNSEEFRDWKDVVYDAEGKMQCPPPTADYLPSCWRAGEIIEARCKKAGESDQECANRAADARRFYLEGYAGGHNVISGVKSEEWLDSGQCRDCFLPAFNFRPGMSTQAALAISNFDDPAKPRRFRFGFIASSDNHEAAAGTGYKEFGRRRGMTEATGARDERWRKLLDQWAFADATPYAVPVDTSDLSRGFATLEAERQASFFLTGGLVATHAGGRNREAIWDALKRREVYGTSGERILLWFNLLNAPGASGASTTLPMGSETGMDVPPRFEVRAVGSFKQKPGCAESTTGALTTGRVEQLCRGECYNPSDERKLITRIEVVRIRPQWRNGQALRDLIDDPWRTFPCQPRQEGCVVTFEDDDFVSAGRDSVYYVRAIEEPSPAVNGGELRCRRDESGKCLAVNPCWGDYRTPMTDDCLATIEERAWSSPIYVNAS